MSSVLLNQNSHYRNKNYSQPAFGMNLIFRGHDKDEFLLKKVGPKIRIVESWAKHPEILRKEPDLNVFVSTNELFIQSGAMKGKQVPNCANPLIIRISKDFKGKDENLDYTEQMGPTFRTELSVQDLETDTKKSVRKIAKHAVKMLKDFNATDKQLGLERGWFRRFIDFFTRKKVPPALPAAMPEITESALSTQSDAKIQKTVDLLNRVMAERSLNNSELNDFDIRLAESGANIEELETEIPETAARLKA